MTADRSGTNSSNDLTETSNLSHPNGALPVLYAAENEIAVITLNRPHRLNAVTPELVEGLCQSLDRAARDSVGAAVLCGAGRAFCSGHDLKHDAGRVSEAEETRQLQRIQDVTRKIRQAPFPVLASVHGYALGAGCEFALCCDLIIASHDAQFGFPEVGVGLGVTGGISSILPWTVGLAKAKELVLLGERFSAREALELRLINAVTPPGDHLNYALELAGRLRDRPRRALALAKSVLDRGAHSSIDVAFDNEVVNSLALHESPDAVKAVSEFRNRSAERAERS